MSTATHQQLYLVLDQTPPQLNNYDVKSTYKTNFLNSNFIFNVIGSSHLIHDANNQYCELISCEKPQSHNIRETIPLTKDTEIQNTYTTDSFKEQITVSGKKLTTKPDPQTQDLTYKFEPQGYTMINILSPTAYETFHTYPEFDLTLHSMTEIIQHS